ncbi:hypothetical protein BFJ63_vAg19093 [Fusarium oxysporum f. sp. narcissi]|uniref:Uncharacterized protein n=1 Tax=Fusarium oxysporum f. sp. narcissi TaxID=451672 RepID=A0A4Q2V128_FUSOX|nr:hypothetical protein BFJ63_vAg19093 [Fusarium oxysporum f. sp. narcissi]
MRGTLIAVAPLLSFGTTVIAKIVVPGPCVILYGNYTGPPDVVKSQFTDFVQRTCVNDIHGKIYPPLVVTGRTTEGAAICGNVPQSWCDTYTLGKTYHPGLSSVDKVDVLFCAPKCTQGN